MRRRHLRFLFAVLLLLGLTACGVHKPRYVEAATVSRPEIHVNAPSYDGDAADRRKLALSRPNRGAGQLLWLLLPLVPSAWFVLAVVVIRTARRNGVVIVAIRR